MDNFIYLAVDGDSAGQLVGRAVLANDVNALHEASNRINHGQDIIRDWAQANGGMLISAGGDEGNVGVPAEAIHNVEQLRSDYQYGTQLTLTVGIGNSLSEAGKALMVGKLRGKNQTCQYDAQVEQEYKVAEQAANDGTATGEGKKLGDAYMKTQAPAPMKESEDSHADCQYCAELAQDNVQDEDHCTYCHGEAQTEQPHCEYCAMADQAAAHDPSAEGHEDNCEYCQAANQQAMDHDHTDDCQYCAQAAAPMDHDHAGDDCQYCADPAQAPQSNIGAPTNDQDMQQIAQEIEQTTQPGETPQDVLAGVTGPKDMPGTEMQDNVSHPANYQQNVPGDMGMAEDTVPEAAPDLSQVLATGLDNHADSIQREKVVQMVSEALQGFKACKQILERAQQQAPQLYDSSISMLRAMIEMAKMLGLSPKPEEAQQAIPGQQDPNVQQVPAQAGSQQGEAQSGKLMG